VIAQMVTERARRWAERVRPAKLRRLYALNALGIHDDALLEEVGWGLHARCQDVLRVWRAVCKGEVACPECEQIVHRPRRRSQSPAATSERFRCPYCRRQLTWWDCREALRNLARCFECHTPLKWRYAQNLLSCVPCRRRWTWQKYRQSVSSRLWLPCPHCGERIRRPERMERGAAKPGAVGRLACPKCGGEALHARGKLTCSRCGYERAWRRYRKQLKRRVERLQCEACGHRFTWQSWREQYRREHLLSGNPVALSRFASRWPACGLPPEKMIAIDALLHAVHGRGALGPVLIGGDEREVMELLDYIAGER